METAKQERAPGRPSAVDQAQAAARVKPPSTLGNVASFLYTNVLTYLLPKKKTLVRAILFALLALLPFLLIVFVKLPHIMIPFFLVVGGTVYALGGERTLEAVPLDEAHVWTRSDLLFSNGPTGRASVSRQRRVEAGRAAAAPKALGTETRGALKAKLKWISTPSSSYSTERYEVHIRPRQLADKDDDSKGWVKLADDLEQTELLLKPLVAGTEYDARVRALNTRGHSEWREYAFATKDQPVLSADGERAGGVGPGYTWAQHLKDESIVLTVGPLPASTRGKQLDVKVLPTTLEVRHNDVAVVSGELFGSVQPEEVEWELADASRAGSGGKAGSDGAARELHITLLKGGKPGGPFWPQLIKGHPEIDISTLKRKEKDLEELMAELNSADAMQGMGRMQQMKKEMNM